MGFFLSRLSGFPRNTIVVDKIIYIVLKPAHKGGRYRIVIIIYIVLKKPSVGLLLVM